MASASGKSEKTVNPLLETVVQIQNKQEETRLLIEKLKSLITEQKTESTKNVHAEPVSKSTRKRKSTSSSPACTNLTTASNSDTVVPLAAKKSKKKAAESVSTTTLAQKSSCTGKGSSSPSSKASSIKPEPPAAKNLKPSVATSTTCLITIGDDDETVDEVCQESTETIYDMCASEFDSFRQFDACREGVSTYSYIRNQENDTKLRIFVAKHKLHSQTGGDVVYETFKNGNKEIGNTGNCWDELAETGKWVSLWDLANEFHLLRTAFKVRMDMDILPEQTSPAEKNKESKSSAVQSSNKHRSRVFNFSNLQALSKFFCDIGIVSAMYHVPGKKTKRAMSRWAYLFPTKEADMVCQALEFIACKYKRLLRKELPPKKKLKRAADSDDEDDDEEEDEEEEEEEEDNNNEDADQKHDKATDNKEQTKKVSARNISDKAEQGVAVDPVSQTGTGSETSQPSK